MRYVVIDTKNKTVRLFDGCDNLSEATQHVLAHAGLIITDEESYNQGPLREDKYKHLGLFKKEKVE